MRETREGLKEKQGNIDKQSEIYFIPLKISKKKRKETGHTYIHVS